MTLFCVEEAMNLYYDEVAEAQAKAEEPEPKPGEITDPAMADAMAEARRIHAETFGTQGG